MSLLAVLGVAVSLNQSTGSAAPQPASTAHLGVASSAASPLTSTASGRRHANHLATKGAHRTATPVLHGGTAPVTHQLPPQPTTHATAATSATRSRRTTPRSSALPSPTPTATSSATSTWADGTLHGDWFANYNGYGSVWQDGDIHLSPKASTSAGETHAALVTSQASYRDVDTTTTMTTLSQLRTGSAPNAWECGWLLWNYTDDTHFYYVALKPNGFELGKEDPAYPGAQRFLVTLSNPRFAIGSSHTIRVNQVGATMIVWVDGSVITTFTDTERPYTAGHVGLYDEDSHVSFTPARSISQS